MSRDGSIYISSKYTRVGRGFWHELKSGHIEVTNDDSASKRRLQTTTYDVVEGEVVGYEIHDTYSSIESILKSTYLSDEDRVLYEQCKSGMLTVVKYGEYEKVYKGSWKSAENLIRHTVYRAGSNRAIKQVTGIEPAYTKMATAELFGESNVTIHTKRSGSGGFQKQIAKYDNNKVAYKYSYQQKSPINVYYKSGKLLATITGQIDSAFLGNGKSVLLNKQYYSTSGNSKGLVKADDNTTKLFNMRTPRNGGEYECVVYDESGKIKHKFKKVNQQLTGECIASYKEMCFIQGVAVTKELFNAEPKDMDAKEVLAIENLQVRSSLMKKMGIENMLKQLDAVLIDEDKEQGYSLHEIDRESLMTAAERNGSNWNRGDAKIRYLKVKCPTSGAYYTLRVPPDTPTCEQARQWTFNVENGTRGDSAKNMDIFNKEMYDMIKET